MRRHGTDDLAEAARAFRDATAAAADGRASRARVLSGAEQRAGRGARRWTLGAAAALMVVLAGAGAWTAVGRWREAVNPPAARPSPVAATAPARVGVNTPAVAPTAAISTPPKAAADQAAEEERAYARAHAAHFRADDPRAALAAWDAYLRRHPRGSLVPEARYNRALILLRLGRRESALEALRPFADGRFGAYRRDDAARLIEAAERSIP